MRSKPKLTYNGLTVVLSNPSRFDVKCSDLLSANGGQFFNACLRPEYNRAQCDIRIREDKSALLPGTKCILLLGEDAMTTWLPSLAGNTLGQCRGGCYEYEGVPCIPSFYPQDCVDMKDYESEYNSYSSNDGTDEKEEGDEKSKHGRTQRKNFGFWLDTDIQNKVKYILKNGVKPSAPAQPIYKIRPSSQEIIHELTNTKGKDFYLDIETDTNRNILCFQYAFADGDISVVPFVDHNYVWCYHNLDRIYHALAIALRDNVAIAHNGYGFDFMLLAMKYKLPIGSKCYDTMIAQHRIFPDTEKSLGHCMSMWTWEPFHKDESNFTYRTPDQCMQLWRYGAKDIHGLRLVHKAQLAFARRIPGMLASIESANAAIKPYITTILQGIRYDQDKVVATMKENDRLMSHYISFINELIGKDSLSVLKGNSKSSVAGSNPQCVKYFHGMLGYPVVGYGKVKQDGTRGPSLGKENIFKLKLKVSNPVLDFIISYREVQTESGYLKFLPWKGDNVYYEP
jgi:hypothetical protein